MKILLSIIVCVMMVGCLTPEQRRAIRPIAKKGAKAGIKAGLKLALKEGKISKEEYDQIIKALE